MIPALFRIPLFVQLFYAAMVIVWQLAGASLTAMGQPAPGPTASLSIAGQAVVVAILFVATLRKSPPVFTLLSLGSAFAAGSSIHHSITADPTLWSSETTRYLSIGINAVGVFAAILVFVAFGRWVRARVGKRSAKSDADQESDSTNPHRHEL
jgi:hypothetical protein